MGRRGIAAALSFGANSIANPRNLVYLHLMRVLPWFLTMVALLANSPSVAQRTPDKEGFRPPPGTEMPANTDELDAFLATQNWKELSVALQRVSHLSAAVKQTNWLHARLLEGGPSMLGFFFVRDMWRIAASVPQDHPDATRGRETAGLFVLYTLQVIVLDGQKCVDKSAPGHRATQLLSGYRDIVFYLQKRPVDRREELVKRAIAFEHRTAPLRKLDESICGAGMDAMSAALEKSRPREVPTPPDQVGQSYVVTPDPSYKPRFHPEDVWRPKVEEARRNMPNLLDQLMRKSDGPNQPTK
jgi:hypothetical protein